jgi:pimeloyl-ACP methyl ester carboxylesterase
VWESLGESDLSAELEELCELSIPALVVHGRHDPIPVDAAAYVADCLCAHLEVLEDAGHVPHVEEFDAFVSVLDQFLPRA